MYVYGIFQKAALRFLLNSIPQLPSPHISLLVGTLCLSYIEFPYTFSSGRWGFILFPISPFFLSSQYIVSYITIFWLSQ